MTFTTFTTQDGLTSNRAETIFQDATGHLWFGTMGGGVSRYDGETFTTFTTGDGLVDNRVASIVQDRAGVFWFGTWGGVSRYDGRTFENFTTRHGLVDNKVYSLLFDSAGVLWIGTWGGVSRYDGKMFENFTTTDGLAGNWVPSMFQDGEGNLWFCCMGGGATRYDRRSFTTFSTRDGLAHPDVVSMVQDREGHLWFATNGGGVSRYDGQRFTSFTTQDGLGHNVLRRGVLLDGRGHLWFGSHGGVVSRYDGQVFQTLTRHDGLTGNSVRAILQDGAGDIWFTTYNGVTRYRPPQPQPPPVFIDAVVADRRYKRVDAVTVSSSVGLVAFEFHGRSFKTRPDGMVYRYRLRGYDADWKNTNAHRVEYENLPQGSYTFEVLAVDRDLVYSERSATVTLKVTSPWYLNGWIAIPSGGAVLSLLIGFIVYGTRYYAQRREAQRLRERMLEQEQRDRQKLQASYDELQETHNELQRTQAHLVQSEKMAGLGTMVAGVAHEINNPINFVYANMPILEGYLSDLKELMQAYDEGASKQEIEDLKEDIDLDFLLGDLDTLIGNCTEGAERVRQIVIDLRRFSRQDEEEKQEADIHEGIESTLTIAHNRLKNRITVHKEFGEIPKIHCYPGQLNQVILNLLTNAADAIKGEGEVWIKTWVDGDFVKSSVRDNGVGIPADALPKIFDPFMTTKPVGSGTGLGLAVSHQIIERHGGEIAVESEAGVGTTLTISIPKT